MKLRLIRVGKWHTKPSYRRGVCDVTLFNVASGVDAKSCDENNIGSGKLCRSYFTLQGVVIESLTDYGRALGFKVGQSLCFHVKARSVSTAQHNIINGLDMPFSGAKHKPLDGANVWQTDTYINQKEGGNSWLICK